MKPVVHYSISFDSVMVSTEDLVLGTRRLLETTRPVVLPVSVPIKTLITSADVLHSWAIPSLGIKIDAVPGRINQFVMEIKHPGYYFGQCSDYVVQCMVLCQLFYMLFIKMILTIE